MDVVTHHININAPLVRPLGIICDDVFKDGLSSLGLSQLELHLRELGREVDVLLRLQVLQAALKSEPGEEKQGLSFDIFLELKMFLLE